MKHRKQKKPTKRALPSSTTAWNRAKSRFGLTPEELAMAKEAGFNPVSMDVSADAFAEVRGS